MILVDSYEYNFSISSYGHSDHRDRDGQSAIAITRYVPNFADTSRTKHFLDFDK
jgi:hypothetical protein